MLYSAGLRAFSLCVPLLTFPYVSRILGPAGVGANEFAASFASYFLFAAALGTPNHGIRAIARSRANRELFDGTFSTVLSVRVVASAIASAVYLALVFSVPQFRALFPLFLAYSAVVCCGAFDLDWFYVGIEDYRYIAARTIAVKLAAVGMIFLLVRRSSDILTYSLINVASAIVGDMISLERTRRLVTFRLGLIRFREHLKPILVLSLPHVLIAAYAYLDSTLVGLLAGSVTVGLYAVPSKIVRSLVGLITGLNVVLLPRLSHQIVCGDDPAVRRLLQRYMDLLLLVGLAAVVLLAVCSREVVMVFGGPQFLRSAPTVVILAPLLIITPLATLYANQILLPRGYDAYMVWGPLAGACVSVAGNLLLVPRLLAEGAALSALLSQTASLAVNLVLVRRLCPVALGRLYHLKCIAVAVVVGGMAWLGVGVWPRGLFGSIVGSLGGLALGAATALLFRYPIVIDMVHRVARSEPHHV